MSKIVGLDPASPLFKYEDVDRRLADTDASYVEVIHTCAGTLGFSKPIGMASFYPNGKRSQIYIQCHAILMPNTLLCYLGGSAQPGCTWDMVGACAHGRAYEYYIESINRPEFYAIKCESFEKFTTGTCSLVNQIARMGGEPGNKKYVNSK